MCGPKDAFAFGAPGAGEQNARVRGLIAAVRREGSRKREAELPALGIGQAQIAPVASGWILFRKCVEHHFAGRVFGVPLHTVDTDAAPCIAAIAKNQNCAWQLLLRENASIAQGDAKFRLLHRDAAHGHSRALHGQRADCGKPGGDENSRHPNTHHAQARR